MHIMFKVVKQLILLFAPCCVAWAWWGL